MKLQDIKPSQLYLNQEKITRLRTFDPFNLSQNTPLPIKQLGNDIFFTDGHTRAFLYFKAGVTEIPVYWDEDVLNMSLYQTCLEWCRKQKITSIGDLEHHVITNETFEELWIKRCQRLIKPEH